MELTQDQVWNLIIGIRLRQEQINSYLAEGAQETWRDSEQRLEDMADELLPAFNKKKKVTITIEE